jgi:DNA-directed RNA polymerase subunit N (RpoN/RPB10)
MLIPILCPTCGIPIADKEDIYNELKEKKKDLGQTNILELLDIKNDCCRMHFITAMIFTDYY